MNGIKLEKSHSNHSNININPMNAEIMGLN